MSKATVQGVCGHSLDSQPDLWIDLIGLLPPKKVIKYVLACGDTTPGLIQAFSCRYANQAATMRGLKKLKYFA